MRGGAYQRIMIATDGSELGKKAVVTGIDIAKLSGAKVYAVYVVTPVAYTARDLGWVRASMENFRAEGKRATAFVEDIAKAANVEVESVILEGHPAEEIVEFAEHNGMDFIVMVTLGKTGFDRFLLGSVAENVIRHSKTPVLVVKGEKSR